jgi:hypothetical protein
MLVNRIKLALGVLLCLLAIGYHEYDKATVVQRTREELSAQYNQKLLEASQKVLQAQKKMQLDSDIKQQEKDAQIKDINSLLANALNELRNRPKRPADSSTDTKIGSSCTGRELYQQDAEFLTREAARADRILVERNYYYNQYESIRRSLGEATD